MKRILYKFSGANFCESGDNNAELNLASYSIVQKQKSKKLKTEAIMKRTLTTIVVIAMLMACFIFNVSAEEIEPCRWDEGLEISVILSFSGTNGTIDCYAYGEDNVTEIRSTLVLYYKNEEGKWKANSIWTYSEDSPSWSATQTFTGTSGVEYKAYLKSVAFTADSSEPASKESYATCP